MHLIDLAKATQFSGRLAEINHHTDLAIAHLQGALRSEPEQERIMQ
jgi:hypothetical protein